MNHYDTLGVSKNASQKEIKNAYKKLIKKYHPDIYPGDKTFAEKKTQEINEAYDILSNEETKKSYDEEINPSSDIYNYTPPKYNNPESYSYQNYYKNNYYDSDFENYKRYADYHRSKVPNSNFTDKNNMHDQFSESIIKSITKMSSNKRIFLIVLILGIYFIFLISSFLKFSSIFKGETNGTILNTTKTAPVQNSTSENIVTTIPDKNQNKEEFNINDYVSEDELEKLYNYYFKDTYSSYSEFKEVFSDYVYNNYY